MAAPTPTTTTAPLTSEDVAAGAHMAPTPDGRAVTGSAMTALGDIGRGQFTANTAANLALAGFTAAPTLGLGTLATTIADFLGLGRSDQTPNDPSPSLDSMASGPGSGAPGTPSSGPGQGGDTNAVSLAAGPANIAIPSTAGVTGAGGGSATGASAPSSVSTPSSSGTGSSFTDMIRNNLMLAMLAQGKVN